MLAIVKSAKVVCFVLEAPFPILSFPEEKESLQFDIYPLESSKTRRRSFFMPENIFSSAKLYSPLHFHGFQAKQKFICSSSRDVSFKEKLRQPSPW